MIVFFLCHFVSDECHVQLEFPAYRTRGLFRLRRFEVTICDFKKNAVLNEDPSHGLRRASCDGESSQT